MTTTATSPNKAIFDQATNELASISSSTLKLSNEAAELNSILLAPKPFIDLDTGITALTGLLGVVIGAAITYAYSKRLSNESQRARYMVQRKNLIYSKLYKELAEILRLVEQLPKNFVVLEVDTDENSYTGRSTVFYVNGNRYRAPRYKIWSEIKKDIRKTYVSEPIKLKLNELETVFKDYRAILKKYSDEVGMNQKDHVIYMDQHGHNKTVEVSSYLFFSTNINAESIIEQAMGRIAQTDAEVIKMVKPKVEGYVNTCVKSTSRALLIEKYSILTQELKITLEEIERLIIFVVKKYEYGE